MRRAMDSVQHQCNQTFHMQSTEHATSLLAAGVYILTIVKNNKKAIGCNVITVAPKLPTPTAKKKSGCIGYGCWIPTITQRYQTYCSSEYHSKDSVTSIIHGNVKKDPNTTGLFER